MRDDLIYDVGVHGGEDTAYYLARGYRVVAIEADPTLVQAAHERFAQHVASGRLTLLNFAVGDVDGTAKFWICPTSRVWNSFEESIAARAGPGHYAIEVPVRRFSGVLKEHGVPHYLKIDIEGFDDRCLAGIDPQDPPRYVSWEMSGPEEIPLAVSKGYNAFKLVSQTRFEVVAPHADAQPAAASHGRTNWRAALGRTLPSPVKRVLRAGKRLLSGRGVCGSEGVVVRRLAWEGGSWAFTFGSSGPFGDDLGGEWLSAEEAARTFLDIQARRDAGVPVWQGDWFDMHATIRTST